MKVLVIHTLPPDRPDTGRTAAELDLHEAAQNIVAVLPLSVLCGVRGDPSEMLGLIELHQPDVVFNLCEAPLGRPDLEAHVAALLEWLGVRFTGCGSETLALCRRKDRVKQVLCSAGVPVPADLDLRQPMFPCIVKPSAEDGSAGLDQDSICESSTALSRAVERLSGRPLIEEFMPGREFAVSLWGCSEPDFVSLGETIFSNGLHLITYAAKWQPESADFANSPLFYDSDIAPALREAIVEVAGRAWQAVGARHYLRVDLRLNAAGKPYVLDVNPNPEISPGVGICRAVHEAGWPWRDFVNKVVEWA